jgi:hypothetical protein
VRRSFYQERHIREAAHPHQRGQSIGTDRAGLGRLFQSTSDQAGADRNMSSNARGA